MTRVLLFGAFDPLHEGHRYLFRQARELGDHLTVVVARDAAIQAQKGRTSFLQEHERLAYVAEDPAVDEAMLGDKDPASYHILMSHGFDILALGYDQKPSDEDIQTILESLHLSHVRVIRLASHRPEIYKSSLLRSDILIGHE